MEPMVKTHNAKKALAYIAMGYRLKDIINVSDNSLPIPLQVYILELISASVKKRKIQLF